MQKAVAIIPVRMSSQRLPGKPLAEIGGVTLVERVWRQAKLSQELAAIYVATDSEEIRSVAEGFGAAVVMTSPEITTGSQRVAAAASLLGLRDELVVNVQGDMPFINPKLIDETIHLAKANPQWGMVTAATPISDPAAFQSLNVVKVVVAADGRALYFSRAPIPASRDGDLLTVNLPFLNDALVYGFKHFGLYVFRASSLSCYEVEELSPLEQVEKLEQLRLLEQGVAIGVYIADSRLTTDSIEVDTPADLEAANAQVK